MIKGKTSLFKKNIYILCIFVNISNKPQTCKEKTTKNQE